MARAQTGTGKTAAFGLSMMERLLVSDRRARQPRRPRSLVLVPTRELAMQVGTALDGFGRAVNAQTAVVYGGVPMTRQTRALHRGVDVLVATPGRLLDHMQQRTVDLSGVEILTLDEADRLLDMGFLPALRRILEAVPAARQTLLFSATLPADVLQLAQAFTRDPLRIDVSAGQVVAPTVTHRVYPVSDGRKGDMLTHVLQQPPIGQALVFCKTKRGSNRVGEYLERAGITAAVIHGNKSQAARNRALADFKNQRVSVLVATDIAARGIDIAELPLVINYDLPLVAADYVHRIGRTGRAGLPGRAVSLVSPSERALLKDIERLLPSAVEHVNVKGFEVPRPTPGASAEWRRHEHPGRRPARRGGNQRHASRAGAGARRSRPRGHVA